MIRFYLFLFLALHNLSALDINFTTSQKSWIQKNGVIKLGSTDNWPPFDLKDTNGKYIGINPDFYQLLSSKLGIKIEPIINQSWDGVIEDGKSGKSNGVSAMPIAPEYEKDFIFTEPYIKNPVVMILKSDSKFEKPEAIKLISTVKGNDFSNELSAEQQANIKYYDTTEECFQSVLNRQSDAYIGWLADAQYLMVQNSIAGLEVGFHIKSKQSELRIGVRKADRELVDILNLGFSQISEKERLDILSKWVKIAYLQPDSISFTKEEENYINAKIKIRYSIENDSFPIERINDNLKHEGITADFLTLISKRSGLEFEYIPTQSLNEAVNKLKNGEIQLLTSVGQNSTNLNFLNFSQSYLNFPNVVVANNSLTTIESLEQLVGLKIGVKSTLYDELSEIYPFLTLINIDSSPKALDMLSNVQIDAYIDNIMVIGHLINNKGLFNIKVLYKLQTQKELNFAIAKTQPQELLSIINKSLDSITLEERNEIQKKWVSIKIDESINYTLLWQIIAVALVIIFIVFYWSIKLKSLNCKLQTSNKQLFDAQQSLENTHKNIQSSIRYGSLIQCNMLPQDELFQNNFKDYFIFWQPRDVVGGDIYLLEDFKDKILLIVADCTGHGVPGAFVTMLVKAIERQIVGHILSNTLEPNPALILEYFNKTIKNMLKQDSLDISSSNVGFDGVVVVYDKVLNNLKFAGANMGLFFIDSDSKVQLIKGDRKSIGYRKSDVNYRYKEHTIEIDYTKKLYITTDGFIDQIGGEANFPFGNKRFKELLERIQNENFTTQKEILQKELKEYQGKQGRVDDITLIGFEIEARG